MDFKYLAQKHNTPLYVYDFNHIKEQYSSLKNAFNGKKSLICYAIKANSNLSILKLLANEGAGADCVSIGEVKRALLAGIPKYKIIFSGVGKRDEEIKEALELDILMINIESKAELLRVETIAQELNKKARVSVRVNPNIDPKTHPYISTGLSENKFGVEIEEAKALYIYIQKSENLEAIGIHFHIGSQLTDLNPIRESAQKVAELLKSLLAIKLDIRFFDIGGGIGIKYKDEETINLADYSEAISSAIKGIDVTIVCEPGRFIVGNSGYFLTKVLYEKKSEKKRFVIVDGAMNDLIRPTLYSAYHEVSILSENEHLTYADVVGPVCESGDFLAKHVHLPQTNHGDLVIIKSSGAYGFSMSSNYNTRGRAKEIAILDGVDYVIRERETFEDLVKNEMEHIINF